MHCSIPLSAHPISHLHSDGAIDNKILCLLTSHLIQEN